MRSKRFTRVLVYLAVVAVVAVPVAMAFGFDDGVNPPSGTVGTPYNFEFKARNGCTPYSFSIASGALPPGLVMDSGGTISGTPTTAGAFAFWADVRQEGCGCPDTQDSCHSQRPFTIDIAEKLTVTTNIGSPATTGTPYSLQFVATGGGSQVWSLLSGALPAGMTFSPTGLLSGTPTVSGTYDFVVQVTDGARTDPHPVELVVVAPLSVTASAPQTGEVGVELTTPAPTATGGKAPYVWALAAGTLPAGLALDPATGVITGTPSSAGTFPVKLSATDTFRTVATVDIAFVVKAKVAVTTAKLPVTKVGKLYRVTLRTLGGVAPFTWKVTAGKFPVGIRLDRRAGVLGGTPRKAGTFPLTFTVTDSLGETSDVSLKLTVNALPKKKKK